MRRINDVFCFSNNGQDRGSNHERRGGGGGGGFRRRHGGGGGSGVGTRHAGRAGGVPAGRGLPLTQGARRPLRQQGGSRVRLSEDQAEQVSTTEY